MDVFIKIAPQAYKRLRSQIPSESPAHEAIEKATRIEHSVDGVLFRGYHIRCDEEQARIILALAKASCPEIIPAVEEALTRARPA